MGTRRKREANDNHANGDGVADDNHANGDDDDHDDNGDDARGRSDEMDDELGEQFVCQWRGQ